MRVGPQFVHQHQMLWNLTKINHQELLLRLQLKELHSRFVSFSFVQELRELVGLHHDVQLLCLELHVKQFVGERLLPLLEKMDPFDR